MSQQTTKRHRNSTHYTVAQCGTDGCVGALTHQKWTGMSSRFHRSVFFSSGLPRPAKDRDDVDWRRLHVADRLSLHMMECLSPSLLSNSHFNRINKKKTEKFFHAVVQKSRRRLGRTPWHRFVCLTFLVFYFSFFFILR